MSHVCFATKQSFDEPGEISRQLDRTADLDLWNKYTIKVVSLILYVRVCVCVRVCMRARVCDFSYDSRLYCNKRRAARFRKIHEQVRPPPSDRPLTLAPSLIMRAPLPHTALRSIANKRENKRETQGRVRAHVCRNDVFTHARCATVWTTPVC